MANVDPVSKQPVRTVSPTDVQVQIADPTTPSQQAAVDSHGSLATRIANAAGGIVETFTNTGAISLGVGIDVAGVQIDPRQIRALTATDVVTAAQGTAAALAGAWPMEITDGVSKMAVKAASTAAAAADPSAVVALSPNSPLPAGTNLLGRIELDDGTGTAITSTAINSKQRLDVNLASDGVSGSAVPFQTSQVGGSDGTNLHALNTDTSGRLNTNLFVNGATNSATNPVFVTIGTSIPGTAVNYYNATAATVAPAGTDSTSVYTITTGKTLSLKKAFVSAAVHMRCDLQISANGTTWTTIASIFTPFGGGNGTFDYDEISVTESGTGAGVRVVFNNEDQAAATGYVSLCGVEN